MTRVDGRMAYVDDNGFETPVLVSDLVVVMPAGHQKEAMAANLMFDQSVRDVQEKRRKEKEVPAAGAEPAPEEPVVETVHAGLECGLLGEKLPGLDCVSFGPDLTDIHTPRERMHIASVQRTWKLLCEVLKRSK